MSMDKTLRVTEIQRFCMHDGPGVRTTVFLKGCPLRCAWCHNPETQKRNAQLLFYPNKCIGCNGCVTVCEQGVHDIAQTHMLSREKCRLCFACASICPTAALEPCGREMSIAEILSAVKKDEAFYGDQGGVTLSGGEPLAQGETAVELLKACKEHRLSTAVETCGYVDPAMIRAAVPYVDLFLWDIKDTDSPRHRQYTGVANEKILKNLSIANSLGAKIRLRCILVNGVNTDRKHYEALAQIAQEIRNFDCLEILPYHAYGGTKSTFLGLADSGRTEWIPTEQQIQEAKTVLHLKNVKLHS